VVRQIRQGWSPELITGRIIKLWPKEHLCHETIYDWIYQQRKDLIPYLVKAHKKRQRRGYSRKHTKTHIPGRVSIRQRPKEVEMRNTFGHWEADTAVSRQSKAAISVLVERKSRISKIQKLKRKTARNMRANLNRSLGHMPKKFRKSITFDNGSENTEHLEVQKQTGMRTYFCEPFHSWEKGTVENTIGLIRRYLPKKTDFAKVSSKTIKTIERRLNNRPRKCLGFSTPAEVYRRGVAFTP
jgi:IS30 family transposase